MRKTLVATLAALSAVALTACSTPASPSAVSYTHLDVYKRQRVDGLLLATHLTEDLDLEHALAGTPAVSIGSKIELAGIGAVFCDDRLGLRLATEHLISQGHQDLSLIHI